MATSEQKDQVVLDVLKTSSEPMSIWDLLMGGLGDHGFGEYTILASLKRLMTASRVVRTRVPVPKIKRIGNPKDCHEFHYQLAWDGTERRAAGAGK
jgi:hypothetical protein